MATDALLANLCCLGVMALNGGLLLISSWIERSSVQERLPATLAGGTTCLLLTGQQDVDLLLWMSFAGSTLTGVLLVTVAFSLLWQRRQPPNTPPARGPQSASP